MKSIYACYSILHFCILFFPVICYGNNSTVSLFENQGGIIEVRTTINLKGQTVHIPKDCTLLFKNGKITNGRIVLQNTKLEGKVKILCEIEGTVRNDTINVEWFVKGASKEYHLTNTSKMIQSVFDLGASHVIFGRGFYKFNNVKIGGKVEIIGKESIIVPEKLEQNEYDFNFLKNVFYTNDADTIIIKGLSFKGVITSTILPDFKSATVYGEPLIWVDNAKKVVIDRCVFRNIENCTYCSKTYNYYGRKQGSCVSLWDVNDASYINCEQEKCRHDEQVWIIAVNKPIMETRVTYRDNYVHDMTPGPNSSAFTCVTGSCLVENNKVERYNYPGSMFNTFAKRLIIRNNHISNSYCSSVFDACEYSFFHNDEITVENNDIEATNSVMVLGQSEKAIIRNNTFRGLGLYYSTNNRVSTRTAGRYKYWYSNGGVILPVDSETIIEGNVADFTHYDGRCSIAGTKADYGTGKIVEPQKYNNVGANYGCGILIHPIEAKAGNVSIINNEFTSIESLEGLTDDNNLRGIYPQAIRLMNTENCTIKGNIFNGAYHTFQSPDTYSCISIYNYPDVMEGLENPEMLSSKPSQYGNYIIEDNTFNVKAESFVVVAVNPRKNPTNRPQMIIDELTIKGNIVPSAIKKVVPFITDAPIRIIKERIE